MMNLVEAVQKECNRIKEEYIPAYGEIGRAGKHAIRMMKESITLAEAAVASGDAVDCLTALTDLRGYKLPESLE